jgi:hypothetical protein
MLKREIKRIQRKLSPLVDPLAIVAMILVVLLPTVAVLNLSPLSKDGVQTNKRVLGEMDGKPIGFALVGGIHEYIKEEIIDFPTDTSYKYTATISPHQKGRYSKPAFQITNDNSVEKTLEITGSVTIPSQTQISIILDNHEYVVVSSKGEPFTLTVPVKAGSEDIAYIKIVSQNSVLFSNAVELEITEK